MDKIKTYATHLISWPSSSSFLYFAFHCSSFSFACLREYTAFTLDGKFNEHHLQVFVYSEAINPTIIFRGKYFL